MSQIYDDNIFLIRNVTLGTSSGSSTYGGGKIPWGLLRYAFFDTPAGASTSTSPIPAYAIDPPTPPVWPLLARGKFSSDTVYGKERMNTNLRMVRGDNYIFDAIAVLDGEVLDLTGKSLKLTCKKNINDVANVFQLTSTPPSGIVITDAAQGEFTCTISGALTSTLPGYVQRLPFDIEVTSGSNKNTLMRGYLIVVPDVS